jgi:hypothetical protein
MSAARSDSGAGFTSVPNLFFDDFLDSFKSLVELKTYLWIVRQTWGWVQENGGRRQEVDISPNQIAADLGFTGRAIWMAVATLKQRGLILLSNRQGSRTKITIIEPKHVNHSSQVGAADPDKHVKPGSHVGAEHVNHSSQVPMKPGSQVDSKHVNHSSQDMGTTVHMLPVLSLLTERKLNKHTPKNVLSPKTEKLAVEQWYLTEFWPLWQKARNDSRGAGLVAAQKKCRTPEIRAEVLAAVRSQSDERATQDPAFRTHAKTFLSQERWRDPVAPGAAVHSANGTGVINEYKPGREIRIERPVD